MNLFESSRFRDDLTNLGNPYTSAHTTLIQGMIKCTQCFVDVVVQSLSLCGSMDNPMDCSMPGFSVLHYLQSLLKFMSIVLVTPSTISFSAALILLLPSIFSSIRVFSNECLMYIYIQLLLVNSQISFKEEGTSHTCTIVQFKNFLLLKYRHKGIQG